jgi:hypothetical protein
MGDHGGAPLAVAIKTYHRKLCRGRTSHTGIDRWENYRLTDRLAIVGHAHGFPGAGHRGHHCGKERGRDGLGGQAGMTHSGVFW